MWKEFRDFINRGNMIDLAVAVIIGAAFGKVVTDLVNYIIMPPIGLLLGKSDFSSLYWNLSGQNYASLADAQKAGAPVIAYGAWINDLIVFLIIALVIFFIVRAYNRLKSKQQPADEVTTKDCPYCLSTVPLKASRCPNCTSDLTVAGDGRPARELSGTTR